MREFLFRLPVGKSVLKDGLTVPAATQDNLMKSIGVILKKGEKHNIEILIGKEKYTVLLTYVNNKVYNREIVQIRYGSKNPILSKIKEICPYSASTFSDSKVSEESINADDENMEIEITEDAQDVIEIYAIGYAQLEFLCYPQKTVREHIESVKQYIAQKGFSYENGLIENFYLSLKSKPFVILAGTSGTGKTRLVKLFAEAVGAFSENNRYLMVPVRPDWSDSSDLFGHVDLTGNFLPGAMIDFIKQALDNPALPYFLCLDEMNLARVEYYLSDLLSVIETRNFQENKIVSAPLLRDSFYGSDKNAVEKYGTITLPENLYIIGTVNMDETTFPFSKKVLDRANTIEFSFVDLTPHFEDNSGPCIPQGVTNDFLKTKYLILNQCINDHETIEEHCLELNKINEILVQANAQVGYRVRDEIIFYLLNAKETGLLSETEAMDNEIMQKILPRIQGSSSAVKTMLQKLFQLCTGNYSDYSWDDTNIFSQLDKIAHQPDCKYKKSAAKIALMLRRFEEDGFTSYWQ